MKNLIPILIFALFFSCKKSEDKTNSTTQKVETETAKSDVKIPDSIQKNSIFVQPNENGFTRIWVKNNEKEVGYFYADTLNILKVGKYIFENQKPVLQKEINLESTEWSYLEIDSTNIKSQKIGNTNYAFFSSKTTNMGKAVPEQIVHFWMLNPENISENFNLQYVGYPTALSDAIRGSFTKDSKLEKNKTIYKSLLQYAKTSKLIYQPTKAEKNPNHYKNYEEKWEADNQTDNHYGAGYGGVPDTIYSTYYKENLFELNGGTPDEIENENYIIYTTFRGNLLGFDKRKKRYFPIIIESCAHFCNKQIEFLAPEILKITYEDQKSFQIDLGKIVFR